MSKKTIRNNRRSESGDAVSERCARCATHVAKFQARPGEAYWSETVWCPDCGASETFSEIELIRRPIKLAFQIVNGRPVFTWRCPRCGGGPVVVGSMPGRLTKFIESMDSLF